MDEGAQERFEQALGVYVGAASYDDVIDALNSVPPTSELIARIETPESVEWRQGWVEHLVVHDEEQDVSLNLFLLARGRGSEGIGVGAMWRDVTFAFYLGHYDRPRLNAERFTGGVRLHVFADRTITLAVWHPVLHETETGDVAPGF